MSDFDINNLQQRMQGALDNLNKDLSGLRTGRASPDLLNSIAVDAYGSKMPINQVGNINVPEPRMLSVQVWDANLAGPTEKAIRESGLGLNPALEGNVIRIPLPELTEERRKDLTKVAGSNAENARIAVRNVRRDGMDALKKQEKDGDIGKDEMHTKSDEVQKLTDEFVSKIDELLKTKTEEIMQV